MRVKLTNIETILFVGPQKLNSKPSIDLSLIKLLQKDHFHTLVVFVDGGTTHKKKFSQFSNQLSIGDQDSSKEKLQIILSKDKNESDLFWALNLINKKIKNVYFFGFFETNQQPQKSNRLDHLLFNFGELIHFFTSNSQLESARLNHQLVIYSKGNHKINFNGEFSILNFLPNNKLTINGLVKYKLKKATSISVLSSRTLSNRGYGLFEVTATLPFVFYKVDV